MTGITRRATFYASETNRVPTTFHIESDGVLINITVGLTDADGRHVTRVDLSPDDESRGGDGHGYVWHQDGARFIRQHQQ